MSIMIHHEDKDYGPYSLEEAKDLLSKGVLIPDDLVWVDGGNEWVPLKELLSPISPSLRTTTFAVSPPEEKVLNANPPSTRGYLMGAALLALLMVVAVPVIVEVKNAVAPFLTLADTKPAPQPSTDDKFTATGTGSFFAVTMQMNGDSMLATMITDDSHEAQLCDHVMDQIYSLATKNPSASNLKFTVQVAGKKETTVEVQDLDAIRNYQDKKAYESSEHRSFVVGRLMSAGLMPESSLSVTPSSGDASGLIGNTYLYAVAVSPRLGVRFVDSSQVDILRDGVPVPPTCHYTIEGNTIIIPTACSVLRLQIHGDQLMPDDLHYPLVKQ